MAGWPRGETVAQLLSPADKVQDRAGTGVPARSLLTPAMLQRVLAGHPVGNHTYDHVYLLAQKP